MNHLNPKKTGLAVGKLLGGVHLVWAVLVALGMNTIESGISVVVVLERTGTREILVPAPTVYALPQGIELEVPAGVVTSKRKPDLH